MALPLILSVIVGIVYCFERRDNPAKAKTHFKGNLFFATFFCCECCTFILSRRNIY